MPITSKFKASSAAGAFRAAGDYATLPFPHLRLWWYNGAAQADRSNAKSAAHYGGWFAGADGFSADLGSLGLSIPPVGFIGPETWTARDGKSYQAFSSRYVICAPLWPRVRWSEDRSYLAYLVYLATVVDKRIVPFGPGVLYGKSYSGKAVQEAVKKWLADSGEVRNQFAKDVPPNQFYLRLGTFGDQRLQENRKGKGGQVSPIVPCQTPKIAWGQDDDKLTYYFVDDDTYDAMQDCLVQSAEWRKEEQRGNGEHLDESGPGEPEGPPY